MTCAGCDDCAFDTTLHSAENLHEIHITVDHARTEEFIRFCEQAKVKSILVHTENRHGAVKVEPMTSYRFTGTNQAAEIEAHRIAWLMRQAGIDPDRIKIETTPMNPVWEKLLGYWETHLEFIVPIQQIDEFRARVFASDRRYMSRNPKKDTADTYTVMVTIRESGVSRSEFEAIVEAYKTEMASMRLDNKRTIIEYCWLDNDPAYDREWMEA